MKEHERRVVEIIKRAAKAEFPESEIAMDDERILTIFMAKCGYNLTDAARYVATGFLVRDQAPWQLVGRNTPAGLHDPSVFAVPKAR